MSTSFKQPRSLVEERLGPDRWAARVALADDEARRLAEVVERVSAGESRQDALAAVVPDRPYSTMARRLRLFMEGGRDALIDRRAPTGSPRKVTAEVRGAVTVLAKEHPELGASTLADKLEEMLGVRLGGTAMRELLADLGLARPRGWRRGRPRKKDADPPEPEVTVTALRLAGAELLKATEDELGAVRALTVALGGHLADLPAPEGPVVDDCAHRDEQGRFLASYNTPKSRTEADLGGRFDTVARRRGEKDLREMRVAKSSFASRYAKDLALTFLPIVVDTARWSTLAHGQGQYLEELVGYAYMPATLDKHARELKLSGASEVARAATAGFWMGREEPSWDGGVVAYIDASTKPVWTHHFTRCAKVSSNGRVMPAMSTVWLNAGSGTPLVYRTFSGHASVPQQVSEFLGQIEAAAGEGTTERLVVLDRESHAVWLFKELTAGGWAYIVPLRKSVTGDNARFEDVQDWRPYGETGDQTRDGWLWLNDSRSGEGPLRVRVVARKRHRTGKVAWYATSTDPEVHDATAVLDRHFARWPLQEHVFRDGNGRVGLDVHHGYGKVRVTNVAVVSQLEALAATHERTVDKLELELAARDELDDELKDWTAAAADFSDIAATAAADVDRRVADGETNGPDFASAYAELRRSQRWVEEADAQLHRLRDAHVAATQRIATLERRRDKVAAETARREGQTTTYRVDTELDEIMTAYKLTFMNLCRHLLMAHMNERLVLDTLIRSVLTLPGERVTTADTETVRIYRQERDTRAMAAVERACASLNALELTRGPKERPRALRLELVDTGRSQ